MDKRICNFPWRFRPLSARCRSIRRIHRQGGSQQRGQARSRFFERLRPLRSRRKTWSVPSSRIASFGNLRPATIHLPFPPWWPLRSGGSTVVCSVASEYINGAKPGRSFVRFSPLVLCAETTTPSPWSTSLYNQLPLPPSSSAQCLTKTGKVLVSLSGGLWY